MKSIRKEIFDNLLIHCSSFDICGERGKGDKENSLFLYPADLGVTSDGKATIEICFIPVDDGNAAFVQINTTLLENINTGKLPEILMLLNSVNAYCIIGHYGIYADSSELYHKQISIINDLDDVSLSSMLITTIDLILDMLNKDYSRIISCINEL